MLRYLFIGTLLFGASLQAEWHSSQLWFKDYNNPYPNTNYTFQLHAQKWHFMHYDVQRFNDSAVTMRDREINTKIRELMRTENFIDAEHIAVIVSNGTVHLRGTVNEREHFNDIEDKIREIEGVNRVKSHVITNANTSFD